MLDGLVLQKKEKGRKKKKKEKIIKIHIENCLFLDKILARFIYK